MCLKSHWISETKKIYRRMNNWYILGQVQFLFLFFFDCCTLKFLKMQCNPTNKTQALLFLATGLSKSGRFHVKSTWKPYKSNNSTKTLQFYGVQWEGYVSWNPADFTWNPPDFMKIKNMSFCVITKYRSFFRKTKISGLRQPARFPVCQS